MSTTLTKSFTFQNEKKKWLEHKRFPIIGSRHRHMEREYYYKQGEKKEPTFHFAVKSIACFISRGFGVRFLKVFLSALKAVINPLYGILLEMRKEKTSEVVLLPKAHIHFINLLQKES